LTLKACSQHELNGTEPGAGKKLVFKTKIWLLGFYSCWKGFERFFFEFHIFCKALSGVAYQQCREYVGNSTATHALIKMLL